MTRIPLGTVLVQMLATTDEQLQCALAAQHAGDDRRIGALLDVAEPLLAAALEVQLLWARGSVLEAAHRCAHSAFESAHAALAA